jgi:hypothetical protein
MKYKVYIPHTNNIKVTKLCLDNLTNNTKDIIVIDNSIEKDCQVFRDNFEVIETPVQLHTAQTYNYIKNLSIKSQLDCFFFMHSDCMVENKETLNLYSKPLLCSKKIQELGGFMPIIKKISRGTCFVAIVVVC